MIVNFFETAASFNSEPDQAVNYFKNKGLKGTWHWAEMLDAEHDKAFTIAKMMDLDLLRTVKGSLLKHMEAGGTLQSFKKALIPVLQAKGWWGKKEFFDPASGKLTKIQLGSAHRLETIFRTNLQSSYAAGHWERIVAHADQKPYLMYDAVDDHRTRSSHAANDGKAYPVDHPFWNSHYPPNGWNCRCGVIQMDTDDLKAYGLNVSTTMPTKRPWRNPLTQKLEMIPTGVDGGFNHNAGVKLLEHLQELLRQKEGNNDVIAQKLW